MKNLMKKSAKIFLSVVLNLILFSNLTIVQASEATDTAEAIKAMSDLKQCYAPDIPKEGDKPDPKKDPPGYILTIIEESLDPDIGTKPSTLTEDFYTYICYRNTFIIRNGDEETVVPELATDCSKTAEELAKKNPKEYSFYCQQVQVFLSKGGTSLIEGYISTLYNWAFGIVGLLCVLVIIGSAAQISLSGGDTQSIDSAKTRIVKSLAGIVVLALSGLILYTINPNFFIK